MSTLDRTPSCFLKQGYPIYSPTSQYEKSCSPTPLLSRIFRVFKSLQFWWVCQLVSSVAQLCLALCNPTDCSRPGPMSITNPQSLLKLMSIELVIPSNHLILCRPHLSHLQSFPASGSFPMSQFFTSGG